jgi:hypothetical protein
VTGGDDRLNSRVRIVPADEIKRWCHGDLSRRPADTPVCVTDNATAATERIRSSESIEEKLLVGFGGGKSAEYVV